MKVYLEKELTLEEYDGTVNKYYIGKEVDLPIGLLKQGNVIRFKGKLMKIISDKIIYDYPEGRCIVDIEPEKNILGKELAKEKILESWTKSGFEVYQ
jgi:hypothetical protein